MEIEKRKITIALVCGMLGCLCFGSGDWLMLYSDTAHDGTLYWLTQGAAKIPAWCCPFRGLFYTVSRFLS